MARGRLSVTIRDTLGSTTRTSYLGDPDPEIQLTLAETIVRVLDDHLGSESEALQVLAEAIAYCGCKDNSRDTRRFPPGQQSLIDAALVVYLERQKQKDQGRFA